MIIIRSADDAETPRYRFTNSRGGQTWATHFFGFGKNGVGSDGRPNVVGVLHPTAHLVESEYGFESAPHFHVADQFQVFVSGGGSIGKSALKALQVHIRAPIVRTARCAPAPEGCHGLP